jgi:hypothetical protein
LRPRFGRATRSAASSTRSTAPTSDTSTWSICDEPLSEAYELVEDGFVTEDNFRDFTFTNAVKLWSTQNPDFFKGTRVEKEAAAVLKAAQQPALADAAQ